MELCQRFLNEMTKETRNIILHLLGSAAFLCIPVFSSPDFNTDQNLFSINQFLQNFIRYVLLLIFFYLNYYFLLPKLYFSNKKSLFFFAAIISFFVVYFLPNLIFPNDFRPKIHLENRPHLPPNSFFHFLEGGFFQFIFVFAISFLIKLNQRFDAIKEEKQVAEISYLKAQINPHFLFNTLNSLYALTIEKSNDAPNAVLKLSSIMRYVVTESAQDFVPLEKEINYIKDYIDLQKLRIDKDANLKVTIEGELKGKMIAPLIIIPFIENAFKYGVNPDENSFIDIKIKMDSENFVLTVKNSIVNKNLSEDEKTETGIENTIKRLNYIYPEKHLLNIKEEDGTFSVNLTILLQWLEQ